MRINIDYDKIYYNKTYGYFKIIEELETKIVKDGTRRYVKVKFLVTGTEIVSELSHAIKGEVRDPFAPVYYGVGYIGNVPNSQDNILFDRWYSMIKRCYNKNYKRYCQYGGIGITVDPRWHCFEYFIYDCQFLLNYDKFIQNPSMYHLDKDYLQQNIPKEQRVYSKDTCVFLNKYDNINLMAIENKYKASSKYFGVKKM